jgi:hypothetical protein
LKILSKVELYSETVMFPNPHNQIEPSFVFVPASNGTLLYVPFNYFVNKVGESQIEWERMGEKWERMGEWERMGVGENGREWEWERMGVGEKWARSGRKMD